jgi:ribosome-binding protein aMBF1 (putative translation factor)
VFLSGGFCIGKLPRWLLGLGLMGAEAGSVCHIGNSREENTQNQKRETSSGSGVSIQHGIAEKRNMTNISKDFPTRVFRLLNELKIQKRKMTKDQLAEKLCCSRTMLYNYEKSSPAPPHSILHNLAELENV